MISHQDARMMRLKPFIRVFNFVSYVNLIFVTKSWWIYYDLSDLIREKLVYNLVSNMGDYLENEVLEKVTTQNEEEF